jgi:uncharacterized protein
MSVQSFKDRLVFDAAHGTIMDETRRYMLIRPEALMGIFTRLPPGDAGMALQAFMASVHQMGSDSARAYAEHAGGTGEGLVKIVEASAPELGWGRWRFDLAPRRLSLVVENSPFAAGHGPSKTPVCHAIAGMVRAVAGLVFERPVSAEETRCAATGAPDCRFEAKPA